MPETEKESAKINGEEFAIQKHTTLNLQPEVKKKFKLRKGASPKGVIPGKLPVYDVRDFTTVKQAQAYIDKCQELNLVPVLVAV